MKILHQSYKYTHALAASMLFLAGSVFSFAVLLGVDRSPSEPEIPVDPTPYRVYNPAGFEIGRFSSIQEAIWLDDHANGRVE